MATMKQQIEAINQSAAVVREAREELAADFVRLDRDALNKVIRNMSEEVAMSIEDGNESEAGLSARIAASAGFELLDRNDADDRDDVEYWERFERGYQDHKYRSLQ